MSQAVSLSHKIFKSVIARGPCDFDFVLELAYLPLAQIKIRGPQPRKQTNVARLRPPRAKVDNLVWRKAVALLEPMKRALSVGTTLLKFEQA
ncbi:MAG: hypothetical protein EOO12_00035 [Chitinophagaceae bacterium]|nr:MAG: hypothetical protein EOO12_00035 [Chitinophagaceae bacterium]